MFVAHRIVLSVPAMLAFLPLGLDHKQYMFYKRCMKYFVDAGIFSLGPTYSMQIAD